ncbi:hypothetical protein GobsT_66090 [Gemmata obscuriglobus]|uniref:TIGR02996 domain-containing protein n=1 Tax=Gemmata obscuriglobus TaxID=114 RepID=UPI00016C4DAF|nr:TIGR02996 domain-containing protein [Gemmata obscuriglobus]QEG31765.1 hypothetical protein GobsT_66090 [Gemmata obscuriglobus]VTS11111.1 unnamed protein product [Gemmata obscuriglobus UQM 2246]
MDEEAGFLAAIGLAPAEDTTRLAYADWLDEQSDPGCRAKAEFIRLETRLATEPVDDYPALTAHLRQLAAGLNPDWLAVVSRPPVENCRGRLDQECPGAWSRLVPSELNARTCGSCLKTVHYVRSLADAQPHVRARSPVVVSLGVVREPGDIPPSRLLWNACWERPALLERKRLSRNGNGPRPDPPHPGAEEAREPPRPAPPRRQNRRPRRIERENWEELE